MAHRSGAKRGKRNQKKQRNKKGYGSRSRSTTDYEEDIEVAVRFCECCESDRELKAFCGVCKGFICDECFQEHQTDERYEYHYSHTVDGVDEVAELEAKGIGICPKHYLEHLNFYCADCSEMICYYCTVLDHQKPSRHNFKNLKDVANDMKNEYSDVISQTPSPAQAYRVVDDHIRRVKKDFLKETDEIKVDIAKRKNRMTSTVRTKYRNLEREINSVKKSHIKAVVLASELDQEDVNIREYRARVLPRLMIKIHEMEFCTLRATVTYRLENMCLSTEQEMSMEKRLERINTDNGQESSDESQKKQKKKRSKCNQSNDETTLSEEFPNPAQYLNSIVLGTHWEELLSVGELGDEEEGQLQYARGVTITKNDEIIVADDVRKRVYIYDNAGKYRTMFHPEQTVEGRPAYACSLAVTSKNDVVLADMTIFVKVYNYEGVFLQYASIFSLF